MVRLMRTVWWAVMALAGVALVVQMALALSELGEMPTAERQENQDRVEQVSGAVQAYAADSSRLPSSLSDLVPRFLGLSFLEDTRGRDYQYQIVLVESDGADTAVAGYTISFDVGEDDCLLQVSADVAGWDCATFPAGTVSAEG